MKQFKLLSLAFFSILYMSCTNDDIYQEEENDNNNLIIESVRDNLPCEFDFSIYSTNDEILIGCNYDLNGQTITFPENITLKYDGGLLTNGTIILDGGHIDGKLLNIDLEVEGSARLISSDFLFEKEKWNIIEGLVSTSEALTNRKNINIAIGQVSSLRGFTFEVNDLDAYFDVQAGFGGSKIENYKRSIQLPSNFHLKMNDNTHLRVQPNDKRDYALLCAFSEINIKITGGHIWGDRYTHDYDGGDTGVQDLGYGIYFIGVVNGVVDGVSADKFTGDGFIISSPIKRNDDGSENQSSHYGEVYFSKNLIVRNSTFDDNRRNGLALTDVEGALLENLTFTNTGWGIRGEGEPYGWQGVIPRHAIDLEAIQYFNDDGITLKLTEIVDDVIIRNSVFQNNYGDIDFYKASNVDVYGNTFGAGSGGVGAFNVKLHDNTFIADNPNRSRGINIKPLIRSNGSHFVKNWEIYNNIISGYKNGICIGGQNQIINNNTVTDFDNGILLLTGIDIELNNNILSSTRTNSRGFYNFPGGVSLENVSVIGGSVDVKLFPVLAIKINENGGDISGGMGLTFDGVEFNSTSNYNVDLRNSGHITIRNSSTSDGIIQSNCVNITLANND